MNGTHGEQSRAAQPARPGGVAGSLLAHPKFGPLPGLLLILTAVTGVVDAVSILSLGRVFVANMTGNVVFAGFALVGAPGFSLSASLFALAGFLLGAAAGGMITRSGRDRGLLLRASTAAEVVLAAAALLLVALSGDPGVSHGTLAVSASFGPDVADGIAALLAIAMGVQNAVARKLAVPDMTTTVLTMLLTGLGADFRAVLRERGRVGRANRTALSDLSRRLLVVATMLAGGVSAAWLVLNVSPLAALALGTALLALTAVGAALAASRPGDWRLAPAPPANR